MKDVHTVSLSARVLIADDEALVALDLQNMLEQMGYEVVHVVHSAEDAIEAAARSSLDVALLDIRMPGLLDGLDAGWELSRQKDIPVVYVTAYSDERTLLRAKESAPYGYLVKPLDDREVRTTIELALYRHGIDRMSRENARHYEDLFLKNPAAQLLCTVNGTIVDCNPAFARLLGYADQELALKDAALPLELTDPGSSPLYAEIETNGIVESRQIFLTRADGSGRAVLASGQVYSVQWGRLAEILWTMLPLEDTAG